MEYSVRPGQVQDLPHNLPNLLVNPGFEIWQRGTSGSLSAAGFAESGADEWLLDILPHTGLTLATSRIAGVSGYGVRMTLTAAGIGSNFGSLVQGVENWSSFRNLVMTFSVEVKASAASLVRAALMDSRGLTDADASFSTWNVGTGWERLTVTRTIRDGLVAGSTSFPHGFPLAAFVYLMAPAATAYTCDVDNATLVVGEFPEGIPYVPDNQDNEIQKCKRFFDMGESSVTGVERNVRNWQGSDNLLINGGFEVWQRGNGPFVSGISLAGSADEWFVDTSCGTTVTPEASIVRSGAASLKAVHTSGSTNHGRVLQGVEAYSSLEGLYVTFSAWVRATVADKVCIFLLDYNGSADTAASGWHSGSGNWERLTVVKKVRTGLLTYPSRPHQFGLVAGLYIDKDTTTTAYFDGVTVVAGNYPDGVPFVPLSRQDDENRCYRFYYKSDSPVIVVRYTSVAVNAFAASIPGNGFYPVPMYATPTVTTYPNSSFTSAGNVRANIGGVEHNDPTYNIGIYRDMVVYWNDNTGPLNAVNDFFYCWYTAEVP